MEQDIAESGGPARKKKSVSPEGLEENLKKGVSEVLVLFLLREREMYVNELTEALTKRSGGQLNIVFPYAVLYRLLDAHYIRESEKRRAPDGRRRQYYRTTEAGEAYLEELLKVLRDFMGGVWKILESKGGDDDGE